jgi:phage terminase Nu1 subunit (DNA packaging protein)
MKTKGVEKVAAKEVARRLLIDERSLRYMVSEKGAPKHGHGKDAFFEWDEIFTWFLAYRLDLAVQKACPKLDKEDSANLNEAVERRAIAEAALAELKLSRERGEVIAVSDVEKTVGNANANVRTRLLAIPSKLAAQIAGVSSKPKVKAMLEKEIIETLAELAATSGDVAI